MIKCIAHAYLSHGKLIVKPSEEVYLEQDQIDTLGDKVEIVGGADETEQTEDNETQEQDAQNDSEETEEQMTAQSLQNMTVPELRQMASDKGIEGYSTMNKGQLVEVLNE